MARNPELDATLTIQLTSEDKAMIKADAKALGMIPSKYVLMVCKLINESARETATSEFAQNLTKSVLKGLAK